MKITALETIRIAEFVNLLWLKVHTSEGIVGLGETFFLPETVEAYVHENLAQKLLGRNPLEIDRISKDLVGYLGFRSTGAEMRGNSALDIALWDVFGKVTGQPLAQLLGGFSRSKIRTYNTCAGASYMRKAIGQTTLNYGTTAGESGPYDDLNGFLHRADELATELLSEGITAMKIWPFDHAAERTDGTYISSEDLKAALVPFEKIRNAVGDKIDVMVEFHSMWQLLPAMTIARALRPFDTFWHEDPIKMDSLGSLKRYAEASTAPICASETLGGRSRVSRSPGNRRGRRHHAGPLLVRRRLRSQEDRRHGGSLASSNCASRLHRSGRPGRFDTPCAQRTERLGSGERTRLLPHLVSRPCDRPAGSHRRSDLGRPPAGARRRTSPGSCQAIYPGEPHERAQVERRSTKN